MRQVPQPTYLVIGKGRVATHFCHYLRLLGLSFYQWSKKQSVNDLRKASQFSTHVLLLISDDQIESFVQNHSFFSQRVCVHFSGALLTERAYSAHPLMTFGEDLLSPELYTQIPFVVVENQPSFEKLLPGFPNPAYVIRAKDKKLYHALCVMAGNFSFLLWQKLFKEFEKQLGLPADIAFPYMRQITQNLIQGPVSKKSFTGPLARADWVTVQENLDSLSKDPFRKIYESFVNVYEEDTL